MKHPHGETENCVLTGINAVGYNNVAINYMILHCITFSWFAILNL